MSDCHPIEQQARQDALDAAYAADGRHDPQHPCHSTYTALMSTEPEAPAAPSLEDQLAAWWRQSYPNATLNPQTGQMMVAWATWLLAEQPAADA
jgi:hypothetical protein